MLDQLKKNAKFQAFLQDMQQKPEANQLDLASYLIMPVQRKYLCHLNTITRGTFSDTISRIHIRYKN
jgi:hypothetical protein